MTIFEPKNFDVWNQVKKAIDTKVVDRNLFFHEREVWWSSLGINVGVESDGKNDNFERPVLIVKKFNSHMLWVLPLTGKKGNNNFHYPIQMENKISWVCLSQLKTISTKRLLRKVRVISEKDFNIILEKTAMFLKNGNRLSAVSSEAEATNE